MLVTLFNIPYIILLSALLLFSFRYIDAYDGSSYTGGYKKSWKNNKGEEVRADGSREIAYYVDGDKEGAAKYYDQNGNEQERFYRNGKLIEQ